MAAELLQEERHAFAPAGVSELAEPIQVEGPASGLTLAAGDEPVQPCEIQPSKGAQQRFRRHEAHRRRHGSQVVNPPGELGRLH